MLRTHNIFLSLLALLPFLCFGQQNIVFTHPDLPDLLQGNYSVEDYQDENALQELESILDDLPAKVSTDSLQAYLRQLSDFENRNTGSDTLSSTFGIGAARQWIHEKMETFAPERLIVSYLQFDQNICDMGRHKNVVAVLPGIGAQKHEVVLVEGHMDSRCEDPCGINCEAQGAEDNGSGTVLVMELARVMSRYAFNRTIVFMTTTGEEQGLFGANAFAEYCEQAEVKLMGVFNNDTVGGIICGATASLPGCPGLNAIDSINVRIYSQGGTGSIHKGLARYLKLEYEENIAPRLAVRSEINLMTPEDRIGRGGDHIPFRQRGFAAIRMTSAHEHGNGNPSTPDYDDRQHTSSDRIGVDTDGDGEIDQFFVDFNYLRRNAIINANAMIALANAPSAPQGLTLTRGENFIALAIEDEQDALAYRVGLRFSGSNDFDSLYTFDSKLDTIRGLPTDIYSFSVCSVDENGIESLFTKEQRLVFTTNTDELSYDSQQIELLQNHPNPFDEATIIGVVVQEKIPSGNASIVVHNLEGKVITKLPIQLKLGVNEVVYDYQYHNYTPGTYAYSLVIDGQYFATKQMIYAY